MRRELLNSKRKRRSNHRKNNRSILFSLIHLRKAWKSSFIPYIHCYLMTLKNCRRFGFST